MFRLSEVAQYLGLPWTGGADPVITGVQIDSRKLRPGELFVALQGARDGHDFLAAAHAAGAAAALVSTSVTVPLPQLRVADTLLALGELAAAWRRRFTLPLIALTGSSGKTTVKELLAASLTASGAQVLATMGNLNNHLGVPLTLLKLRAEHQVAVIEMGANHPGEIAHLTQMAQPTVALVNNAGPAHLAGFGSLDGVAQAKGEIYAGLAPDGVALVNADDPYAPLWDKLAAPRRTLHFGLQPTAEVRAVGITGQLSTQGLRTTARVLTPVGEFDLQLPLAGEHNVRNALAATAAALAVGTPLTAIAAGLAQVQPVPGRLLSHRLASGTWLIDDTYNANPASVRAAIAVLAALPGERWLILGDLGELGAAAETLHHELGVAARVAGIERLFAVGTLSAQTVAGFGHGGTWCATQAELLAQLPWQTVPTAILVKGSRSAKMEVIVQELLLR